MLYELNIDKSHPCHKAIYGKKSGRKIEWIVIHFVGNPLVPAKNFAICNEHNNAKRDASWHYCVGNSSENYKIYQSVEDKDVAWHCGTAGKYKHATCRNSNSIGIEHCFYYKGKKAIFEQGTIETSAKLVANLLQTYNLTIDRVIRHYDVTGKECPQPFLYNDGAWENYLKLVETYLTAEEKKEDDPELFEAVRQLILHGAKIEFNMWKAERLFKLQYADECIIKVVNGVYALQLAKYEDAINYLITKKIITNSAIWLNKEALSKKANMTALLKKIAKDIITPII